MSNDVRRTRTEQAEREREREREREKEREREREENETDFETRAEWTERLGRKEEERRNLCRVYSCL